MMSNPRVPAADHGQVIRPERSEWLRLRTLVLLRWMAILGQSVALLVANRYLGMQMPLGLCFLAVGLAVIANLVSSFVFPANKRLSETEAMLSLLFDLSQLTFLLYLTGGLTNPFTLLILAPVTVSASALALRSTLVLGGLALVFLTLIGLLNVPLRHADGSEFQVPGLFEFGFWLSILIGTAFLGLYSHRVATEMHSMSDALLATQMALAREQKLTDLGGVVAAAAHELGTPLATIKLVSTELMEELADSPELAEDARLIREQADRCRDILRSMGKTGKDDAHLRHGLLTAVLHESAEPHLGRGIEVQISVTQAPGFVGKEPTITRRPELIHGLRNLVQNAVDFARKRIWIEAVHSGSQVKIRIIDDGAGFPAHLIGRIGDPFLRVRQGGNVDAERPGYEGMGLGLFIAKTLLERTGASLSFANAANPFLAPEELPDRSGAVVEVVWPLAAIASSAEKALGENAPISDFA
jgi:two-component system, sensor histidine kinase RegB